MTKEHRLCRKDKTSGLARPSHHVPFPVSTDPETITFRFSSLSFPFLKYSVHSQFRSAFLRASIFCSNRNTFFIIRLDTHSLSSHLPIISVLHSASLPTTQHAIPVPDNISFRYHPLHYDLFLEKRMTSLYYCHKYPLAREKQRNRYRRKPQPRNFNGKKYTYKNNIISSCLTFPYTSPMNRHCGY